MPAAPDRQDVAGGKREPARHQLALTVLDVAVLKFEGGLATPAVEQVPRIVGL
jgi:hypothetical protein